MQKMRRVDPEVRQYVIETVQVKTDESLMSQFGISYNTWRKLDADEPVRLTVATRLEDRFMRQIRYASRL